MTVQEQAAREELLQELTRLRREALGAPALPRPPVIISEHRPGDHSIARCRALPLHRWLPRQHHLRSAAPGTAGSHEALLGSVGSRLHRHVPLHRSRRALRVARSPAGRQSDHSASTSGCAASNCQRDDYTGAHHGRRSAGWTGIEATSSVLERLQLPVRQVSRLDEDEPGAAYFEVTGEDGHPVIHRPRLDESRGR